VKDESPIQGAGTQPAPGPAPGPAPAGHRAGTEPAHRQLQVGRDTGRELRRRGLLPARSRLGVDSPDTGGQLGVNSQLTPSTRATAVGVDSGRPGSTRSRIRKAGAELAHPSRLPPVLN
jgi:hypothetical protein